MAATKPLLQASAEDRLELSSHRFSVEDYHRMIRSGVFVDKRVELLDGVVVDKMAQNPPHSSTVHRLIKILEKRLPSDWIVRGQLPITLKTSEPEPDAAVVLGPMERYDERHPEPRDIGLLIEVAEDSLQRDREQKSEIYAEARVAYYWIVNLVDKAVEVYSQPKSGRLPAYKSITPYRAPQSVPLIVSGKTIANIPVKEILP